MAGTAVVSIVAEASPMVESWSQAFTARGMQVGRIEPTVYQLLTDPQRPDVALLDLRLADGTSPGDNIVALLQAGASSVVVISGAEDRALIQQAARAGASGLIRRTVDATEVAAHVARASIGHEVVSADWAAAIDTDPLLGDVALSVDEESVLGDVASGESLESVAARRGATTEQVADAVGTIRMRLTEAARALSSHPPTHGRADAQGDSKDMP